MEVIKAIGRYLRSQVFAIFWTLAIIVGGLLTVALGTVIGVMSVLLFALFALIAPIIGLSLKSGIEELSKAVDKANAKVQAAQAKKPGNVAPFKRP